jgi:probable rRNA maturation factor
MILLDPDLETDVSPQAKVPPKSGDANRPAGVLRRRIPSRQTLARFLREAQAMVKLRGHVSVLLTTDNEIRRLNRQFRGKNKATDVLSFPAMPLEDAKAADRVAGDLAISVPTAQRQADQLHHSLATEIKVLILHGLLHLAGYDHETDEGEMARREQKLRGALRLPHGLIERTLHNSPKVGETARRSLGAHTSPAKGGRP